MPQLKKGFAHMILVLIIAFAGVGALGYYAYKNGQVKISSENNNLKPTISRLSTTPSLAVDATASWKIYTNSKYSYSFKYPEYLVQDDSVEDFVRLYKPTEGNNVDIFISFSSFKRSDYGESLLFTEFLINRAIQNCAADGVGTSMYCDKKIESSEYTNEQGTVIQKFYLNLVRVDGNINEIHNSNKGPLWGIDITGQDKTDVVALYIEADHGDANSKNIDLAQKIVDTITLLN